MWLDRLHIQRKQSDPFEAVSTSTKRIVVTGVGAISVAGSTISELEKTLYNPRPLFHKPTRFNLNYEIIAGEIDTQRIPVSPFPDYDTMTGRLALQAAGECLEDARIKGAHPAQAVIHGLLSPLFLEIHPKNLSA